MLDTTPDLRLDGNVIVCYGELTWELDDIFDDLCGRLLASSHEDIVLDLSDAGFMSSPYVSRLLRLHYDAIGKGMRLKVIVSARLEALFDSSGLSSVLRVERTAPATP